jgi:hypothetical protein
MKKYFVLVLFSLHLFSQEKSKIIFSNETVTISAEDKLEISTLVSEKRAISKSKNTDEYSVRIPFDSFSEVTNIKGSTFIVSSNKTENLSYTSIGTYDAKNENIYKSDNKYKFLFSQK